MRIHGGDSAFCYYNGTRTKLPAQTILIVVPFAAGGPADITARTVGPCMTEPRQYSRETVLMARAGIVVAGSALEALGAVVLGFGAFARGNLCVYVFYRVLYFLLRRAWPPNH